MVAITSPNAQDGIAQFAAIRVLSIGQPLDVDCGGWAARQKVLPQFFAGIGSGHTADAADIRGFREKNQRPGLRTDQTRDPGKIGAEFLWWDMLQDGIGEQKIRWIVGEFGDHRLADDGQIWPLCCQHRRGYQLKSVAIVLDSDLYGHGFQLVNGKLR
jgi:hypothetical protein